MRAEDSVSMIKGVGAKTTALFSKLHIDTAGQLACHFPRSYEHYEPVVPIAGLVPGTVAAVSACVIGTPSVVRAGGLSIIHAVVGDATGRMRLTWFHMPYLKKVLQPGTVHVFRGTVKSGAKNAVLMEHPKMFQVQEYGALAGSWQPGYALTPGLSDRMFLKCVRQVLDQLDFPDYLPREERERYRLIPLAQAMEGIHFPKDESALKAARRRLVFDEFLAFLVQIRRQKAENDRLLVDRPLIRTRETDDLIAALPYSLTGAQKRVWGEIEEDLQRHGAMNRLVQGDVGSGKTILAFLALLMCAANGRQGCLMAPTEVLASQHYEALQELTERYGLCIRPALLTGSLTAAQKRKVREQIASGSVNVAIGTHALIQEKVIWQDLALVVTDEQHRFGVRQREDLAGKGESAHVLVMSATPIPRTLAIVLYGDLHVSLLDEMPKNRLPIKNCVVDPGFRKKAYAFLQARVEAGEQAYVICPMVEEGEMEGVENVLDYSEKLKAALPGVRISPLHGKMKAAEKQRIMDDFAARRLDVLVSTTVIEVGINVPNATVMLVENAERFGLAQLHQLRGRVGRGKKQSYCIFMTGDGSGKNNRRLDVLNRSNDGFFIAAEDLKLRGPGDLFGIRQSGALEFSLGDIYQDSDVLLEAGELADRILNGETDPGLEEAVTKSGRRIDYRTI
ncbi:MAG TPA: ATP-dependent DNA helicase RecG [Candidatus Eisenbergiella merdigallinarum]|uniref:Probable DNA 3'-5' helicase RecG n=1 Tax=Candidatus Eisenbergiella merdigallinarum TaxID=2838552 RepID=A0A9D2SDD3_9FIRM|nr:ATP-dependent DNA helicase RecG [Candidatus Eisenbergiella merdigallinarum]